MNNYSKVKFPIFGDGRGELISIEGNKDIPFEIKRVYYMTKFANSPRGFHAHKKLSQVILCLSGCFSLKLDDGVNNETYILNSTNEGVLIHNLVWREMHDFSDDCVIIVLASEQYDESDYIRNRCDFEKLTR